MLPLPNGCALLASCASRGCHLQQHDTPLLHPLLDCHVGLLALPFRAENAKTRICQRCAACRTELWPFAVAPGCQLLRLVGWRSNCHVQAALLLVLTVSEPPA